MKVLKYLKNKDNKEKVISAEQNDLIQNNKTSENDNKNNISEKENANKKEKKDIEKQKDYSAIKIQTNWKRYKAKEFYKQKKKEKEEKILKIQKNWRRYNARKNYEKKKKGKEEKTLKEEKILKIQKNWRGYNAREIYKKDQEFKKTEEKEMGKYGFLFKHPELIILLNDSNDKKEFITSLNKKLEETFLNFNENKKNEQEINQKNNIPNNISNNTSPRINISKEIINDYSDMYTQMKNDIFTEDAALELIAYRELLRQNGIINALKNIFSTPNKITWYPSTNLTSGPSKYVAFDFVSTKEEGSYKIIQKNTDGYTKLQGKEKQKMKLLGGIYVDDKPFKGLRCDGSCKNKTNCASCLLFLLLKKLKIHDDTNRNMSNKAPKGFCKLYYNYAIDSTRSSSNSIRNIIRKCLKEKVVSDQDLNKLLEDKYDDPYIVRGSGSNAGKEIDKQTKQYIMIEWALTVELLKLLSPIIYKNNDNKNTILFRTIPTNVLHGSRDLFESTSLFGPAYLATDMFKQSYTKFSQVPIYRCIFNYIISPGAFSMFNQEGFLDSEQEIGCITLELNFEELFNNENAMKDFDNDWDKNNNNVGKDENFEGKKILFFRNNFLIRQFMEQVKQNIIKTGNGGKIKKVISPAIFPEYRYDRGFYNSVEKIEIDIE